MKLKKQQQKAKKNQINMKSIRLFSLFIVKITKIITKSLHHMTDNYLQCTTFGIYIYIYTEGRLSSLCIYIHILNILSCTEEASETSAKHFQTKMFF